MNDYLVTPENAAKGSFLRRKSGLHQFSNCPYSYLIKFLIGIQGEASPAMEFGTFFHDLAEVAFDKVDHDEIDAGNVYEEFMKHLPHVTEDAEEGDMNYDFMGYLQHIPDGVVIFENWAKMEQQRWDNLEDKSWFWPLLREQRLESYDLMFSGTTDRLDQITSKTAMVIDYKTGKMHKWLMSKYRLELFGYKTLIELCTDKMKKDGSLPKDYRLNITEGAIIFPKTKEVFTVTFKTQTENAFYRKLDAQVKMLEERNFPKKETMLCEWCTMFEDCQLDNLKPMTDEYVRYLKEEQEKLE